MRAASERQSRRSRRRIATWPWRFCGHWRLRRLDAPKLDRRPTRAHKNRVLAATEFASTACAWRARAQRQPLRADVAVQRFVQVQAVAQRARVSLHLRSSPRRRGWRAQQWQRCCVRDARRTRAWKRYAGKLTVPGDRNPRNRDRPRRRAARTGTRRQRRAAIHDAGVGSGVVSRRSNSSRPTASGRHPPREKNR